MKFVRTDGTNKDFIQSCILLDRDLDRRVGQEIQRDKFEVHNQLNDIKEAIVVYDNNSLVGGGAMRKYNETDVELKRVFISPDYQGKGIGTKLVSLLIEWAKELGYSRMILETGELLKEACAVYKKMGFEMIPNYGPYVDISESVCMAITLKDM